MHTSGVGEILGVDGRRVERVIGRDVQPPMTERMLQSYLDGNVLGVCTCRSGGI